MNMRRSSMLIVLASVLLISFALSFSAVAAAQEATPEPATPANATTFAREEAPIHPITNNMLLLAIIVIGLGSLALAAHTSQQAAQGIPLPAFIQLSKSLLEAGARFALPIGADIANRTPTKLDDVAITELAKASGWKVSTDPETGKIILTAPDENKSNV